MPVKFNNDGFTIEVKTATNPIECWMETQHELIDLLGHCDRISESEHVHFLELLRSMMPDVETAKKML